MALSNGYARENYCSIDLEASSDSLEGQRVYSCVTWLSKRVSNMIHHHFANFKKLGLLKTVGLELALLAQLAINPILHTDQCAIS